MKNVVGAENRAETMNKRSASQTLAEDKSIRRHPPCRNSRDTRTNLRFYRDISSTNNLILARRLNPGETSTRALPP